MKSYIYIYIYNIQVARAPRIKHNIFRTNDLELDVDVELDLHLDLHLDLDLDLDLGQWLSRPVWCKFQCGKDHVLVMNSEA